VQPKCFAFVLCTCVHVCVVQIFNSCFTDDDDESPDKYAYNARAGEGQYCL